MAITHVASTSAQNGATTSRSVNVPSGTANDDFMLLVACTRGGSLIDASISGWTPINDTATGTAGSDIRMRTWYRIASSEPGSYNVTLDVSGPIACGITTYRGVDTSNPIVAAVEAVVQTAPTVTTDTAGRVVLVCAQRVTSLGPISATAPASYTERIDQDIGGATDTGIHTFDRDTPPNPSGTAIDTHAAAGGNAVTQHIALRNASAAPLRRHQSPTRRRALVAMLGGRRS